MGGPKSSCHSPDTESVGCNTRAGRMTAGPDSSVGLHPDGDSSDIGVRSGSRTPGENILAARY